MCGPEWTGGHAGSPLEFDAGQYENGTKRENPLTGGLQSKRLKAAWDQGYLWKVLTA